MNVQSSRSLYDVYLLIRITSYKIPFSIFLSLNDNSGTLNDMRMKMLHLFIFFGDALGTISPFIVCLRLNIYFLIAVAALTSVVYMHVHVARNALINRRVVAVSRPSIFACHNPQTPVSVLQPALIHRHSPLLLHS